MLTLNTPLMSIAIHVGARLGGWRSYRCSDQTQAPAGQGHSNDADQDRAEHAVADHPEEQAHPGAHGVAQADGNAVEQPFTHPRERQAHEQHAGDKHRAQRGFPGVAHGADHGVGEERVQTHARRQAHRPVGVQAHQQATQRGGNAGGNERRAVVNAGVGHDIGVDEDDVGHGDEGGKAGDQLGPHCGAMQAQFEQAFQPAVL
ncbi:hypothetical protein Ddc_20405 [Ditylenchus destructor]|nr:hypothetical protein Ddc_20405 [Ditylenchus destructor]